jgi:hypothetical protein
LEKGVGHRWSDSAGAGEWEIRSGGNLSRFVSGQDSLSLPQIKRREFKFRAGGDLSPCERSEPLGDIDADRSDVRKANGSKTVVIRIPFH